MPSIQVAIGPTASLTAASMPDGSVSSAASVVVVITGPPLPRRGSSGSSRPGIPPKSTFFIRLSPVRPTMTWSTWRSSARSTSTSTGWPWRVMPSALAPTSLAFFSAGSSNCVVAAWISCSRSPARNSFSSLVWNEYGDHGIAWTMSTSALAHRASRRPRASARSLASLLSIPIRMLVMTLPGRWSTSRRAGRANRERGRALFLRGQAMLVPGRFLRSWSFWMRGQVPAESAGGLIW